ncbi:MAG: glycerophosphodiester phosphodiesterase [Alistipes sp.]|nr:glycerophosphodiester phosphodiesterase [Alistipes sp.]MBQ3208495.1 glycerophosphodiester phosphodiesterase [Alistipes sp.]
MKKILTVAAAALISVTAMAQPQVIAHRGFHATKGSCRNSIEALKQAQKLGLYGSECDINLTKDGVIVVAHGGMHPDKSAYRKGEDIPRLNIQKSTYEELTTIPLENGETIPTLEQYLEQAKKSKKTKLIIEIKNHYTPAKETEIVQKTVEMVAKYGLNDMVEYIAFRPWVCFELKRIAPEGTPIAYLNGDYDATYVKGMGISGIDYKYDVLKKKPKWIKSCQKRGLTVNVWTVNDEDKLRWVIEQGVDFITTDDPVLATKLIKEMCK